MSDPSSHSDLRALMQGETPPLEAVVNETRARMDPMAQERAELASRLRTGQVNPQDNRPLLELAGIVGGGCILLGFASMAFTTGVHPASLGLVGLGALLVGGYAVADWARVKRVLSARSTLYSANLGVTVGVLLAILVVINLLANRYYHVIDLTANGLNSLSPQSLDLLEKLRESGREIQITAFYPKDKAHKEEIRAIETVYARYTKENPHLKFSIVDPDINANLAREKGITVPGTFLFEAGENSTKINSLQEPEITGALLRVTNPESKVVYFVVGHNEFPIEGSGNDGLETLATLLGHENLVVKPLSIPREGTVPVDAAAVVLVAPREIPLQLRELAALDEYLARGGNLMVLLEPNTAPEVKGWLAGYGIRVRDDIVIDPTHHAFDEPTAALLLPLESQHPLVPSPMVADATLLTPSARSLEMVQGKAAWTPLYSTEDELSFGETNPSGVLEWDAADPRGPLTVVAAGQLNGLEKGGRLFVAGDADWLSNNHIAQPFHNQDFAVNAVAWLVGSDDQIAIRPKLPNQSKVDLTGAAEKIVVGTVFGIPLVVAAAGVLVWWKRRSW
ncbi:MAG TPA: GldG family protein [bacterium]|nr:GldG family protein [bacterium]